MKRADNINLILILIIIVLAGLLRFWRFTDLPFTSDEFHAVLAAASDRTEPAGAYQFLLGDWTNLAGKGEMAVKLPFILLGIGSVGLIFVLGREWFSVSAGLLSAALLAALEFPVMYSQQARPYVAALFFVLLMIYAWHRFLHGKRQQTDQTRQPLSLTWLIVYVIAGTACAYLHLFSLLMVGLVFIGGLPFLRRRTFVPYVAAGALITLLFLPGLNDPLQEIRSATLEGWAESQDPSSIRRFIEFSLQFSPMLYILLGGIWSGGLYLSWQQRSWPGRPYILSVCLVSFPVLIAYFYSAGKGFVPHHAIYLPILPFILFLVTGWIPELNKWLNLMLLLLVLPLLVWSLSEERQYYRLAYHSRYEQGILETMAVLDEIGEDKCLVLMDTDPLITDYYARKLGFRNATPAYHDSAAHELVSLLDSSIQTHLSLIMDSESDHALPRVVMQSFPRMMKKHDYYGGNHYLFAGPVRPGEETSSPQTGAAGLQPEADAGMEIARTITRQRFEEELEHWSPGIDSLYQSIPGRPGEQIYRLDPPHEFSPTFSYRLSRLNMHPNDLIDVSVSVLTDSISRGMIVLAVHSDGGLLEWTGRHFQDFNSGSGAWYRVHHAYRPGRHGDRHDIELKIYVWNPGQEQIYLDDLSVSHRKGNPVLYGLLERIE